MKHAMTVGLLGACLFTPTAARAVTTSATTLAQDANAVTDDGQLAGRVTNLLRVTVPTGFDWTNSSIRITLTQGSVYNASNAVATESSPNAAFWSIAGFRNGRYDSFVNSKGTGGTPDDAPASASILGTLNADGSNGPTPALGLTSNNATLVSASWGNTTAGEDGTFAVGRFTLSSNAVGTFFGRSGDNTGGGLVPFSGTIANGVLTIPEPASLGSVGLLAGAALFRRRRAADA